MTAPDETTEEAPAVEPDAVEVAEPPVGMPTFTIGPDGKCGCGKNGTPEAHGWIGTRIGYTCAEIRVMQNLYEAAERRRYVHRGVASVREALRRRAVAALRRVLGAERVDALIGEEQ